MVQDIAQNSFWDKYPRLKPYAMLARWDRPIGFWLLYWPCVWGMAFAPHFRELDNAGRTTLLFLFLVGAIAMRGAGCTLNDLIDRKIDARVERTKTRPLANNAVKPWQAVIFLLLQLSVGALVLSRLSPLAIYLGLGCLPLIAAYPFMKRFTWYPQAFLALNFAAGGLIGWAAVENTLHLPAFLLYAAGICWVIAYDTVYAHMDIKDDGLIGLKSTALRWGPDAKKYVGLLWLATLILFGVVLFLSKATLIGYVVLVFAGIVLGIAHTFWPPEKDDYTLRFFRLQNQIGLLLALAALAPVLL